MEPTISPPWHHIPASQATCKVTLMQAGGLYIPTDMVLLPAPGSSDTCEKSEKSSADLKSFYAPDYIFLIEHTTQQAKYIFDLGMRKDLENLPPLIKENVLPQFKCEPQSPADILWKYGREDQQPANIKAVIFSHMHFDHVGDGAKSGFDNAELWVGPTCCTYARPGYPVEQGAPTLSENLPTDGSRKIIEAYIPDHNLEQTSDKRAGKVMEGMKRGLYNGVDLKHSDWKGLGAFDRAFDVFGDGSAYLIDAPGHSAGHQMMLIRTTSAANGKSTFVLLAGDCFHHPKVLENPERLARPPFSKEGMHADPDVAMDTIWRTRKFAEQDNIWVLAAHDSSVGDSIEPGKKEIEGLVEISDWSKRGWKKRLNNGV